MIIEIVITGVLGIDTTIALVINAAIIVVVVGWLTGAGLGG